MNDVRENSSFDSESHKSPSSAKSHTHAFHAHDAHNHETTDAVSQIRKKHKQTKSRTKKKDGKRRIIFWGQVLAVLFVFIAAGLTIRAIGIATAKSGSASWVEDMKQGNYSIAAGKFKITASAAVSQVFTSDFSTERVMRDFNAALPHLRKAGYILTEMEVELGIPPKLIPHFYHDPKVKLNLKKTLRSLGDNSIGAALIVALAEAGDLQKQVEVADMQFNHIEVELGPIPALRLKYKNDNAIKHYIHRE